MVIRACDTDSNVWRDTQAMRYPPDAYKKELQKEKKKEDDKTDEEIVKEIEEDLEDDGI